MQTNTQHTTHATTIQAHTTQMHICPPTKLQLYKYQIYTCTQHQSYILQVIHTYTHIWKEINACTHTFTYTHNVNNSQATHIHSHTQNAYIEA